MDAQTEKYSTNLECLRYFVKFEIELDTFLRINDRLSLNFKMWNHAPKLELCLDFHTRYIPPVHGLKLVSLVFILWVFPYKMSPSLFLC